MKILNVEQIREADKYTIENEPISSIDLMERAAKQVVKWVSDTVGKQHKVIILAGSGNNGGDGLAIARLLAEQEYFVKVVLTMGKEGSNDFKINLQRLESVKNVEFSDELDAFVTQNNVIFIDAVFGSGLSRTIQGSIADYIRQANESKGIKIAVDIPSGLFADEPSPVGETFIADHTLSFQVPKLAFMMAENQKFVGRLEILDIGLSKEFISNCRSDYSIYGISHEVKASIKVKATAHKGDRGRACIVAGGHGRMGAAIIAAKGALHSGIGLLTVQTCPQCIDIIQMQIPEALIFKDENEYVLGSFLNYVKQDALVFGPAVGFAKKTVALFKNILQNYGGQLILDADAITILAENRELLELIPQGTILTPHHGEFKRLVGNYSNNFEALMQLKSFCKHHKVVVILKGKFSATCNEKGLVSFNRTGNQGMAKGGSGDLLCGILAGLAPRINDPFQTAKLATFLHGIAGDKSLKIYGENYMTPSTMILNLKDAFELLEK